MGGTKRKETGTTSNALLVHPNCHSKIESHREVALQNGWLLHQADNPLEVPVKLWNGIFFLDDNGGANVKELRNGDGQQGVSDT